MSNKYGTLVLVPTPIAEIGEIDNILKQRLMKAINNGNSMFLVEDPKPARRRWLAWGLPRESIESFIYYNEHTSLKLNFELIESLKEGKNLYLMSDGGLPCFCDPGVTLVNLCHINNIKVTSTPFFNSISLAISLSGINSNSFEFLGFPPAKKIEREEFFGRISKYKKTLVIMDTPYRLKLILKELNEYFKNTLCFLAINLGREDEKLYRSSGSSLFKKVIENKSEFILVIDGEKR